MVNKVMLVGHVGKDPESRTIDNGTTVTTFSLATGERYKDKNGENQSITTWHNIVAWRKIAETMGNHVKKGDLIYIEGKITNRSYDAQDGSKKYITEIVADRFNFLPKGGDNSQQQEQNNQVDNNSDPLEVDNLPF
jgi:single-strand DNA-binding protein